METTTIREATGTDAPALVTLINASFIVERAFVDRDRTTLDEVSDCLHKGRFLVAEAAASATVIACVYVENRGRRAYVGLLAVDPAHQRRGMGRFMMNAAESDCRSHGLDAIDIRIVSLRTELPPFYRSLGYVDEGTAPFEDPKLFQPAHFILMSKALR